MHYLVYPTTPLPPACSPHPNDALPPPPPLLQPCGGAIPICMVEEFDLPMEIIDRRVTKMKMISPSNREVDVGKTLNDKEWIGMCRREVFDDYLRKRAAKLGANVINGLMMRMDYDNGDGPITLHYNNYADGSKVGTPATLEVDLVIGADGANSRVAKEIDAGEADYAIAFQERIRIPDDKMEYYKDLAEMYVGDDVSPDFYGWVFPKYDHVAVGTGTVVNKTAIKQYQQATRDRSKVKTEGGTIIRVEAHPIPEHPRPRRVKGRVALVGDAAGYVTKCSGEGIYFAAKSGRMAAEAIVEASENGKKMCGEAAFRTYLDKWDRKYWATYKVLDILQKVFYRSNPAREAFVELCESNYVQSQTFSSYLYKTVNPGSPLDDVKLLVGTVGSLLRSNALRSGKGINVSFGSKNNEEKLVVS
jgi:geranylgeranyl diphosphate/geranylgeranyl-bacteriochlorophyllide a reductase